ncbi:nitrite/sulfite reductase [Amedibacillus sp. YH-ame10]
MNKELYQELEQEIHEFHEKTKQFINKEISVKDYKGYSGGFGSYAQRGGQSFMLRLRMNQGIVTKDKLKFVIDACEKHQVNKAHFTTCQTIQLHDLSGMEISDIMLDALHHDIVCRGGGGDFPRNVMCSPLSGCDPQETFDVIPYAQAVGDYMLTLINKFSLPRKLKIGFSNNDKNETHATFRDLGFVANSDHTFDVYCAGGLGNNPKMGVKVGHHVAGEDILYYVSAMVLIFMQYGNYENRAKARTRYLQEVLGKDGLIEEFQKKVENAFAGEQLKLQVEERIVHKTGNGNIVDRRVTPQKQTGLFAVFYHPIGGTLTPKKLSDIYEVIKDMEDVELRITPQEGVYIVNCTADEAKLVLNITKDGARNEFEESVACIGASTCQVGLRDSQGTLKEAIMYLREKEYADHVLPRIFISGCPSSCGTNQIGPLGFQGTVKVIDKQAFPAYTLSIHGKEALLHATFGETKGVILEEDVCCFLESIANQVSKHTTTYVNWIEEYPEELQTILTTYIK